MKETKKYLWGAFTKETTTAQATPATNAAKNVGSRDMAIILQLAQEFEDRSRKTIKVWREAINAAIDPEKPNFAALQDLYTELTQDGHFQGDMALRKAATKSTRFYIQSKGVEDEEKTKLIKTKWFYQLMDRMLDSITYGYSVVEITTPATLKFALIKRRNCCPTLKGVRPKAFEDTLISYNAPEHLNFVAEFVYDEDNLLGLINSIVPQLIWKRNAQQTWADFSERFGIPLISAETNKSEKKDLDRIEAMLQTMGQSSTAILPEGSKITVHETGNKTDPYNIWDRQIDRCNSEVSKRLLSGTMLSDNGSSRSQSEVHERNLDEKLAEDDRRFVEFSFEEIKPLLIANGLAISPEDTLVFDRSESLTMKEHWDIVNQSLEKFDYDDKGVSWISKRFNIPIKSIKKNTTPSNFKNPSSAGASFEGISIELPQYTAPSCCHEHDIYDADNKYTRKLDALSLKLADKLFNNEKTRAIVAEKTSLLYEMFREALISKWDRLTAETTTDAVVVAYDSPDWATLSQMELNLVHFSFARNLAEQQEYNNLLINKNNVRPYNEFINLVRSRAKDFNVNYARTEYNLAVATGQNTSHLLQAIAEKDKMPFVTYQTVGDGNVRDSHALLNNKTFAIDDTEARKIWPPNDFGCRCEMLQHPGKPSNISTGKWAVGELSKNREAKFINQFLVNRSDVGKVFLQNQFYTQMAMDDFSKTIDSLNYSDYNLDSSLVTRANKQTALLLDDKITEANKNDLFKGDKMEFKDYLNRPVFCKKKVFDIHTEGKYIDERRHQLFAHIPDIMKQPDEVYLYQAGSKSYNIRYVKHYNNESVVVETNFKKNTDITTWYFLHEDIKRTGLLIKKSQ